MVNLTVRAHFYFIRVFLFIMPVKLKKTAKRRRRRGGSDGGEMCRGDGQRGEDSVEREESEMTDGEECRESGRGDGD